MLYSRRPIFYLSSDISLMTSTNSNDESSTSTSTAIPICPLTTVPICPGAPKRAKENAIPRGCLEPRRLSFDSPKQPKTNKSRGGVCTMTPRNLFPAVACPPAPRKSKSKIPIRLPVRRVLDFDPIERLMANFQSEMNHTYMLTGELKVLAVLADL